MRLPLQISTRNVAVGPAVHDLIRRQSRKLDTFYDRIMACRVVLEAPQRFPAGRPVYYNLRLDITVPGGEIVIRRQRHPELLTAVQDAFDAAGRRLQDFARRQRGDVKRRARGAV